MREKGWEERGPKAQLKNSDVGTPTIFRRRLNREVDYILKIVSKSGRTKTGIHKRGIHE